MKDHYIQELASAAIDRKLAPAERDELDRLLEESPQAREMQSDLHRLDAILKKLPDLDAPKSLHVRIVQSARLPAGSTRQQAPRSKDLGRSGTFAPSPAWRYGLAMAAGIVLAVTFYESKPGFGDIPDLGELSGTMAPGRDRKGAEVLDSHAFDIAGLESQVLLERRDEGLLLDIRVEADQPVEIVVDLSSAGARLDAIAQSNHAPDSMEIGPQELRMQASGKTHLTALLNRADDRPDGRNTIGIEFSSDGRLLQRGSLAAAWR